MPLLNAIAHRALRGPASRRLARAIPNPLLRYAAVTAATAIVPMIIAALARRRPPR
jgi:hypothetical protein